MRKGYALTVANPGLHRRRGAPIQSFADRSLKNGSERFGTKKAPLEREDTEGEVARPPGVSPVSPC